MFSLRRLAWMCRDLAKQHADNLDVPAASNRVDRYAGWTQIASTLYRVEPEKSLRETEATSMRCPVSCPCLISMRDRTTAHFVGGKMSIECVSSAEPIVLAVSLPGNTELVDFDRADETNGWRLERLAELFDSPPKQLIRNVKFSG